MKLYVGGPIQASHNPCHGRPGEVEGYGKVLFSPNDPYQEGAHLANIPLTGQQMLGKVDGSIIQDDTVVEFACQHQDANSGFFQWVPKRTRFDKTYEYQQAKRHRQLLWIYLEAVLIRGHTEAKITQSAQWKHLNYRSRPRFNFDHVSGRVDRRLTVDGFFQLVSHYDTLSSGNRATALLGFLQRMFPKIIPSQDSIPVRTNYGNNVKTANSVWRSIHIPVTLDIITTGNNIPPLEVTNDVYYTVPKDSRDRSSTIHLQRFHNYVKRNVMLLPAGRSVATGTDCNVLDLACGKGGDLQKWCDMRAKVVVGIDVSRDNLENVHNGACQRYQELTHPHKPKVYWFQADSRKSIADTLGDNPEYQRLWQGDQSPQFGIQKFPIVSLQFALHYFFEHQSSLTGLLNNVNDNLQVGGLFIGTCLDGKRLAERLRDRTYIQGEQDSRLLWKIEREYSDSELPDTEGCLHRQIQVYMASIGKTHPEYLVNFDYLRQVLAEHPYYLEPLTANEAARIGLPSSYRSTGESAGTISFADIASEIPDTEDFQRKNVSAMSASERSLSYLNCAFVFRKKK